MTQSLTRRPIVIISHKDSDFEVLHPQSVIITCDNIATNGKRYLDFGSLCYARRKSTSSRNRHRSYVGVEVDQTSLDTKRLPIARKLIESARLKQSFASAIGLFATTKPFFDWIDSQEKKYSFDQIESINEAYSDYTRGLLHRVNISGIREMAIKLSTASKLQASARKVVALVTGTHDKEVIALATHIPQSHDLTHVNSKQPNADIQARTFATLVNFVEEAHCILVGGNTFPMRLVSPGCEPYYLYSIQQSSSKVKGAKFSVLRMLSTSPKFPTWEETQEHYNLSGPASKNFYNYSNYESQRIRHIQNNTNLRCDLRLQMANHSMTAGMLAFIAATGCNLSIAQDLEVTNSEIVPSTQGQRFYGTKARANGKTVYPEFGARFAPVFKKILELREWILNGRKSNLVFPISPKWMDTIGYVGTSAFQTLRTLFKKMHPNTVWVSPVQWRKNVGYQYVNNSGGDLALTAEKLGNTESTLRKNYSRPALEDFATQLTGFFEAMHLAAVVRTRDADLIPVHITTKKQPDMVTGVGSCEKGPVTEPRRALGFTEQAPEPSCHNPETCLFCDFYAVHADEEDIRRLLSLRYLIQTTRPQHDHDHWEIKFGPTVHRIDEVLTAINNTDRTLEDTISRIRNEVESGYLDSFWAIHFDTLVYVGAVS
ncbi:hypothetical protein SAMN05660489_05570 [Pseudomonas sp. LAMO17WK12:I10]|uniref:hypothetical protein n=1 Tax=unclassified Pseudomonas TaxID=196821 RepID=UPI000BDAFFBC|nr:MULTISPECIES: hypothetical protein [unclassified Pseudomonas]PXX55659.1 hypothetical protein H160_05496 [Pseudomonas sp. LAMO17WK12:I9]SNY50860.1 hypothetical protein SAMN05660489_05570 [Pseudomonas sp. LAMO17WK12:I10]